jgi:hypothetical protein
MTQIIYPATSESLIDPYAANVTFLSKCNGATDETGKTIYVNGQTLAQLNTSALELSGNWIFPVESTGSVSDYIGIVHSTDLNLGNSDFTIELVVSSSSWYTGASYFGLVFCAKRGASTNLGYSFSYYNGNISFTYTLAGVAPFIENRFPFIPANNRMYLIAVTRAGSNLTCSVDGIQIGTTLNIGTDSIYASTESLRIGGDGYNDHGKGVIYWIRITKGVSRDILLPSAKPWTLSL